MYFSAVETHVPDTMPRETQVAEGAKGPKGPTVILCTGSYELIDEERAKSIGITEYVTKPFTFDRLAKAVFDVIVGRSVNHLEEKTYDCCHGRP